MTDANQKLQGALAPFEATIDATRSDREELYKWFHQHPELSLEEVETSGRIEEELARMGYDVISVGKTGKVAVLENGEGPTVLFRADFDALPLPEQTGLEYSADPELGRMHACGHDMHTTALLGAADAMMQHQDLWSGTFIALFQPGEETGHGALDMVNSGLAQMVPEPDIVLGQHIGPVLQNFGMGALSGPVYATCVQTKITLYGKGSHGSMPQHGVDPVVMAAEAVMALQTIVSRNMDPAEMTVLTVGAIHGGQSTNTVADSVELGVSTRAYTKKLSDEINDKIKRVVRGVAQAYGAEREPEFEVLGGGPEFYNNEEATDTVMAAFREQFGDRAGDFGRLGLSEDFPNIAGAWGAPYFFWFVGCNEDLSKAAPNHSPQFAPDLQPTLDVATRTILTGLSPYLMKK